MEPSCERSRPLWRSRLALAACLVVTQLAGCRACEDGGGGGDPPPPMPTGMLAPAPSGSAAAPADVAARLRVARRQTGGAFVELQIARPGDSADRVAFDHWQPASRFVPLDAMTLMHDAFARAKPGFDPFLPQLYDPAALGRLASELRAFRGQLGRVETAADARARWGASSELVRGLASDADWRAARGALLETVDELAAMAQDLSSKRESLWVLGV